MNRDKSLNSVDMSLQAKEAFYKELEDLDVPLEDEDEFAVDESRQQFRTFFKQAKPSSRRSSRPSQSRPRPKDITESSAKELSTPATRLFRGRATEVAASAPTTIETTPLDSNKSQRVTRRRLLENTSFVEDTPPQQHKASGIPALQRAITDQNLTSSTPKRSSGASTSIMPSSSGSRRTPPGKRKARGNNKDNVPEEKRILKGLQFLYIPEDRVSLRKQRMQHAEKYGATVTNQLDKATHVVVDKHLKYDEIKEIVTSTALEKGHLQIVTEDWPLECIQMGRIIPVLLKHRVKGVPLKESTPSTKEPEPLASQSSDQSLKIKQPYKITRSVAYALPSTPSQSTASPPAAYNLNVVGPTPSVAREPTNRSTNQIIPQATSEGSSRNMTDMRVHGDVVDPSLDYDDDLSQIISEACQRFKDIPRIGEEDANLQPGIAEANGSDTESQEPKKKKRKKKGDNGTPNKKFDESFACNRGGTEEAVANKNNPNAFTISVLQTMLDYYIQTNDHWRRLAYSRSITTLSKITDRAITTAEEARELPYFGERLSAKLEEIVTTHTLQRLQHALNDPISQVKSLFLGIYGVGPFTADKWIAQGFRTLDDLLRSADLSFSQRIGVEYYDDINSRIPRDEVTQIGDYVKAEAAKIDSKVELIIGGSYRRDAKTSGDVDFIITKKGTTSTQDLSWFLGKLVGNLSKKGFLTAELATRSSSKDDGGSKWHGCCVLPRISGFNDNDSYKPVWRRIDLLLVPETEYGAALIYFTGNDIFNRSLRLLASKKQMRLNQRGLYRDKTSGKDRLQGAEGELLEGRDEKRIFEILGVKWRKPRDRWC